MCRIAFIALLLVSVAARAEISAFEGKVLTVKPWIALAGFGYDLKDADTESAVLNWKPNTRAATGVDFYIHGWFGFGIGGLTEMKSEDQVLKGDTNATDYRLSFPFRSFQVIANYQDIKGFYLDNTQFVNPARQPTDPYYQRPDMHSVHASILFTWILDPSQYSIEAATDQSVRQGTSGGSWLIGASAAQARFSDTSPLVPTAVANRFGSDSGVTSMDFTSLIARGGYGYTLAITQKWFLTGQFQAGLGPQFAHYSNGVTSHEDSRGVLEADVLASTGYNGDQFLSGIMLGVNATNYRTASLEIPVSLETLKAYIGTRF